MLKAKNNILTSRGTEVSSRQELLGGSCRTLRTLEDVTERSPVSKIQRGGGGGGGEKNFGGTELFQKKTKCRKEHLVLANRLRSD